MKESHLLQITNWLNGNEFRVVETYQEVINRDNFNDSTLRQEYQENVLKKVQAMVEMDHPDKLWWKFEH